MKVFVCVAILYAVGVVLCQEEAGQVQQETLTSIDDGADLQGDDTDGARDKRLIGKLALAKIGVLGLGAVAAKTAIVGGGALLAAKSLGYHGYGRGYGGYGGYGHGYGHGYSGHGGYGHGYGGYGGYGNNYGGYGHGYGNGYSGVGLTIKAGYGGYGNGYGNYGGYGGYGGYGSGYGGYKKYYW